MITHNTQTSGSTAAWCWGWSEHSYELFSHPSGRTQQSVRPASGQHNIWEKIKSCVPISRAALFPNEPLHIYPVAVLSWWPAAPFFIDPISPVSVVALQASYLSDGACCLDSCRTQGVCARAYDCASTHPSMCCSRACLCVCVCLPCIIWHGAVKWRSVKCHIWRIRYPGCWGGLRGWYSLSFPLL